ncbi:MAG: hypothetical protein HFJ18_02480 [Clostridia bacterium]|nr:hypothetical protein [Clostridia bacterium]
MKNINNIMRIIMVIFALIILSGIIMICVKGYNYDLLYSKSVRMNIYLTKEFKVNEIEEIAKEILGTNKLKVQQGNTFGTVVSIVAKEITEEQQNNIIQKLNEKYEIEINKDEDLIVAQIPQVNIMEITTKYISPLVITTIVILVYFVIRYRSQGIIKCIGIPVLTLIGVSALYVSIIALTRIPVNEFFTIFLVLIYFLTLICNAIKLNKQEI